MASAITAGVEARPLHFGPEQRLFGLYESPTENAFDLGVVLCAPVGHEYVRCHRVCRQLALRLVRAGFPVLRFDYLGCGDSTGDSDEVRLDDWVADVSAAIDLVRQRCRRICLVGLRIGGSLGYLLAARRDVDVLVLWQPVVEGRGFWREVLVQQEAHEAEYRWAQGESARRARKPGTVREVLGFPYSSALVQELESLDLCERPAPAVDRVLLLSNTGDADLNRLEACLKPVTAQLDRRVAEEKRLWMAEPYEMVVPQQSIKLVSDWISGLVR